MSTDDGCDDQQLPVGASGQSECSYDETTSDEWGSEEEEGGVSDGWDSSGEEEEEEDGDDDEKNVQPPWCLPAWVMRFAVLGDGGCSLLASAILLLAAAGVRFGGVLSSMEGLSGSSLGSGSISVDAPVDEEALYNALGPVPSVGQPVIYELSDPQVLNETLGTAFDRDGVVAVRGLLSEDLLERLEEESTLLLERMVREGKIGKKNTTGKQFHAVQHQLALRNPPSVEGGRPYNNVTAFLNVSLFSPVPRVAAALLLPLAANASCSDGSEDNNNNDNNLRLIRDIFLTKDNDPYVCGWHVDDYGFWPTSADSPGINAWIALDDMPIEMGGGFALAVKSHSARWQNEAHRAIGATTTAPKSGFTSALDLFQSRKGSGTCNLETAAPHIHRRMEETMRVYDLRRGDVIFHHRWLFHRTVPMEQEAGSASTGNRVYRRYSLRYGPGSSVIPPGYGTETSVLWNEANGGRTVDQISQLDGSWYPQAFPAVVEDELKGLQDLVSNKMPVAEERKAARLQEMQPLLRQVANRQLEKRETKQDDNDWCVQRLKFS